PFLAADPPALAGVATRLRSPCLGCSDFLRLGRCFALLPIHQGHRWARGECELRLRLISWGAADLDGAEVMACRTATGLSRMHLGANSLGLPHDLQAVHG